MATNIYFNPGVKSEQLLYEDIIIESLKMYGQDVYYLPRELVNEDKIFSDDSISKFSRNYKLFQTLSSHPHQPAPWQFCTFRALLCYPRGNRQGANR